jgi:hypothetical protein
MCSTAHGSRGGKIVVPVVIDDSRDAPAVACVPVARGSTGSQVLQVRARLLGVPPPTYNASGLLCSIDGYPSSGCGVHSGNHYAYWAYFHGGASWTYANGGPAAWPVTPGDVEGWRFEPDGSGTPSDPPPRAPSSAPALCPASPPPTTTTTVAPSSGHGGGAPAQSGNGTPTPASGGGATTTGHGNASSNTTSAPGSGRVTSGSTTTSDTVPAATGAAGIGGSSAVGSSPSGAPTHLAARHTDPGSTGAVFGVVVAVALIAALGAAAWFRRRRSVGTGYG